MNFKFEEEAIVFFHLIHFHHLMGFYVQTGQAVNHADGTPKGFEDISIATEWASK